MVAGVFDMFHGSFDYIQYGKNSWAWFRGILHYRMESADDSYIYQTRANRRQILYYVFKNKEDPI